MATTFFDKSTLSAFRIRISWACSSSQSDPPWAVYFRVGIIYEYLVLKFWGFSRIAFLSNSKIQWGRERFKWNVEFWDLPWTFSLINLRWFLRIFSKYVTIFKTKLPKFLRFQKIFEDFQGFLSISMDFKAFWEWGLHDSQDLSSKILKIRGWGRGPKRQGICPP